MLSFAVRVVREPYFHYVMVKMSSTMLLRAAVVISVFRVSGFSMAVCLSSFFRGEAPG